MNCEAAKMLFGEHIDGTIPPEKEAALQAHLSVCKSCREELAALAALEKNLSFLREPAPASLKTNVMDRIRADAKKKQRRRWFGPGAALGAAAAILVLVLGSGIVKLPNRSEERVSPTAEIREETEAPEAAAEGADVEMDLSDGATYAGMETQASVSSYNGLLPEPEAAEDSAVRTTKPAFDSLVTGSPSDPEDTLILRNPAGRSEPILTAEDTLFCTELSERETVPVLAIAGLDEAFPAQLSALAPELGALLEDCEVEERDGRIVIATNIDAAAAIQEWLGLTAQALENENEAAPALPELPFVQSANRFESPEAYREELSMFRRILEFDPDGECLAAVITPEPANQAASLPEAWPADFAARFLREENWALFYPDEDFVPEHGDPAYLVLLPLSVEEN